MLSPRPLVDIAHVKTVMDLHEDAVVELTEEGLLYPAWNIGCGTEASRREIRILSAGLTYYAGTQRPLPADVEEVCCDLIPPDAACTNKTLERTLNCSAWLVAALIKNGGIKLARGERLKLGRYGAGKVDRQSVIQFLKDRVI